MRKSTFLPILLATALAMSGCDEGGGPGIASIPPPPPPPTPTPAPTPPPPIIPAATTSQQFAVIGAAHPGGINAAPLFDTSDQLQVRYVQSSNSYELQLPNSQTWAALTSFSPEGAIWFPGGFAAETGGLSLRKIDYQYSNLFRWGDRGPTVFGFEAIGIATPAGGVPVTGSASYAGLLLGSTPEAPPDDTLFVGGSIDLAFNFAEGTLSGSISPTLLRDDYKTTNLSPTSFRDTVYSTGSTTFSGKFDTSLPGINSFSGMFTGPNAEELIGNFAFPYQSPIDSKTYQADGAFVGKK